MEHDFKKAVTDIRETKLSHKEKGKLFAKLSAYQEMHPIAAPAASPFAFIFSLKSAYTFAAIILLVATGAVAQAAEGALPGEALYAVKVKVNEPIRGALSFTASAKAEWEIEKLERRLEEVERLAVEGKFDNEALAEMEKSIDKHVEDHDSWKEKEEKDRENAKAIVPAPLLPQKRTADIDEKIQEHKPILEDIKSKGNDDQKEKIERIEKKLEEKANRKEKNEEKREDGSSEKSSKKLDHKKGS